MHRPIGHLKALSMLASLHSVFSFPAQIGPPRPGQVLKRRRTTYFPAGLNGKRAVARRLRQIEAGSLREANGLVL